MTPAPVITREQADKLLAAAKSRLPEMIALSKTAPTRTLAAQMGVAIGFVTFAMMIGKGRDLGKPCDPDTLIGVAYTSMLTTLEKMDAGNGQ